MSLRDLISNHTRLADAAWGDCPICNMVDCFLVTEDSWHCYSCGNGGNEDDFKSHRLQEPKKRPPGRPKKC